jgi:hypothetical protein
MRVTILYEQGAPKEVTYESTEYNDNLLIAKIAEKTVGDNFDSLKKEILEEITPKIEGKEG